MKRKISYLNNKINLFHLMYIKRNYTIHALFQKQQPGKKTEFYAKAVILALKSDCGPSPSFNARLNLKTSIMTLEIRIKSGKLISKLSSYSSNTIYLWILLEKGHQWRTKYIFYNQLVIVTLKKKVLEAQTRELLISIICLASYNSIINAA